MAGLIVKNLGHAFGPADVLKNIDFEVHPGEALCVIGPSGGGKSTLLRLCAGLLEVGEGRVENRFKTCSVAFQEPRLLPWKTAIDNIALGLRARGVNKYEAFDRAKEAALKLGLETADFDKFPKDLSGGMRQRVSFARALVVRPDLLFLDEPFSALDIGLKRELWNILSAEIAGRKMALLFITHDLMEAVRLSHTVLLLKADPVGHIVHRFSPDRPLMERDDAYVYQSVAQLLAKPEVIETFGLKV